MSRTAYVRYVRCRRKNERFFGRYFRFLADTLEVLNALLALVLFGAPLVLVVARFGLGYVALGLLLGAALSLVICGFLALFIAMRRELVKIRKIL